MTRHATERLAAPQRALLRQALPLALGALVLALAWDRLAAVDLAQVRAGVHGARPGQWAAAAGLTALSLWALAHYDLAVHRWLGTGIAPGPARRASVAAIAISQLTGAGLLVGTLVRWQMLPGLSPGRALALTGLVGASFLAALGVLAAGLLLALPPTPGTAWLRLAALPVAALGLAVPALAWWAGVRQWRGPWPAAGVMAQLGGLAALDALAAALVFAVFLPPEAPVQALLPAILVAIWVGLATATPAGLGSFEVTFLALAPACGAELPLAQVLSAAVCYRLVYYLLPGAAGLLALLTSRRGALPCARATAKACGPVTAAPLHSALRAEVAVVRQGRGALLVPGGRPVAALRRTASCLVQLFDGFDGAPAHAALHRAARAEGRLPLAYKIGPRAAACARRAGWQVALVAREAWLDPRAFDAGAPACRQLRRKLRKAAAAGIDARVTPHPPLEEMRALARDWAARQGGERGFSMGTFCAGHVAGQLVVVAQHGMQHGGRLAGFATLHRGAREWTLDLMRAAADAPEGTMHALLAEAIAEAARQGLPRLSLAAVPLAPAALPSPLARRYLRAAGAPGLAQFKTAFAPRWEPRYAAAPGRAALALGALEVALAVARRRRSPRALHNLLEICAFARPAVRWHQRGNT